MPYLGLGCLLVASLAFAQGTPASTMPGVWKARESFTGDLARSGATAAEVKTLVGKMDALRALLMASPAVARPVGFNARISGYLTDFLVPERPDLKARDFPLSAGLWFGAFPPEFNDDGSVDWGETIQIPFDVNLLPRWQTNKPTDWQDITTDVVLHPARYVGGFAGLPRFGRLLIIKKNTKPLWTPVSLQETLQLVVAQRKKDVSPYEDAVARIKKEHAAWTAQHAERQRIQKALAPSQKDPQAYLAQAAQLERVEETTFRKQLAEMTPTANQFWAAALARLREAEHDLGSLSAAEGAVPACLLERVEATAPLSRFVPATTPNCRPVIRPNWDYFDRSLPRTEIQLITIGLRECSNDLNVASGPNPAGCPTNLALLRSLDWESVKALMERGGDPVGRARPSR